MSGNRRRFLAVAAGAAGAAVVGCRGVPTRSCPQPPSTGPGLGYCLVDSVEVRLSAAALLTVGQVALHNLDDRSAVIVARDEQGFYALSGICTHQCCILTLCDASCAAVLTNPGDCASTPTGTLVREGGAFVCACHGSEFAADGSVLSGPAVERLPSIALRRDGDDLLADLGTPAPSTARAT